LIRRSIPIGEDLLRFYYLLFGAGESEFQFSRLARDLNFDSFEAVTFRAGAQLFVGFVEAVFLEAIAHGRESGRTAGKAMLNVEYFWRILVLF
jgi:hypothetical protein